MSEIYFLSKWKISCQWSEQLWAGCKKKKKELHVNALDARQIIKQSSILDNMGKLVLVRYVKGGNE